MRNAAIAGVLAATFLGLPAQATIQLFFTSSAEPYGLTNPALAFTPTLGDSTDAAAYQVSAFPPSDVWGQIPQVVWPNGEFAYMWVRFVGEANNRKIQRAEIDLDDVPVDVAYFVMDDVDGDNGARRWDQAYTLPGAPAYRQDPQQLLAATAAGIRNRATADDAWNLYDNITRTALLGAVRYDSIGVRSGIAGTPPSPIPPPAYPWVVGAAAWVPEPTPPILLSVIVGALRRR